MTPIIKNVQFKLFLTSVLMLLGGICVVSPTVAHASSVSNNVSCSDGTTKLKISKKGNSQVVSCASGAKIFYNSSNDADNNQPVAVSLSCPGDQTIGSSVADENTANASISFYCTESGGVNADGDPVRKRTSSAPTAKQTDAVGTVLCGDGTTEAPDGDVQKCPADAEANTGNCANLSKCDLISKYIKPFIAFLSALVGVAVVFSIIVGGIQYSSSAADPQAVTAAKNRIRNALLALVTYIFLLALLNFLIPGGLK